MSRGTGRRSRLRRARPIRRAHRLRRCRLQGDRLGERGRDRLALGSDSPFTFDVTEALHADGANLLAIRVLNPTDDPIDGLTLAQTPHGNKTIKGFRPGNAYDFGGILLPVDVRVVPPVRIEDVAVRAVPESGTVEVAIAFRNDLASAVDARLDARIMSGSHDAVHASAMIDVTVSPGATLQTVHLSVASPHLWDIADPFLYRLGLRLASDPVDADSIDARDVRFGFRDFRIVDGFFHLNGRRLFIRSTHTGNHYPAGWVVPTNPSSTGATSSMPRPSATTWSGSSRDWRGRTSSTSATSSDSWSTRSPALPGCSRHRPTCRPSSTVKIASMVRRDRNHPSVVIWGMLNETYDGPVFRHAVEALARVRDLDASRLVLLSSGRWDARPTIGSASNPGTDTWQPSGASRRRMPASSRSRQRTGPARAGRAISGGWPTSRRPATSTCTHSCHTMTRRST